MKPSFAIIGCGRVGKALGRHLAEAGYRPAGFASRRIASARQAAEAAGKPDCFFEHPRDATEKADIVFITVPDDTINAVCGQIFENKGFSENAIVFHCSGALASTELASARPAGLVSSVRIGSMHPLQSFAAETSGNPFNNIMMAVEGDPGAVEKAREIALNLGARPFTISTRGKVLYHAAAVVASNYLVTLMDLAIQLMAASGAGESEAFEILTPLIKGTLNNIKTIGIPDALTGPIARGDAGIVEKHVKAIEALSAQLSVNNAEAMAAYYMENGRQTIRIARSKGTLSKAAADQLLGVLRPKY